ncbi:MAG: DNA topoisomerase, partial [Patescibacteria group bacterium]|nr:DNA topoisomerase [Patescibacteria group bacterium]
ITQNYTKNYLDIKRFKTKSKVAQEAHEAIRPTSCYREPEKIKEYLTPDQFKLYDLIWRRTLASQMSTTIFINTAADIKAKEYIFRANGLRIKFDGWMKIFPEKQNETLLPDLKINDKINLIKLIPAQHFTEPPARFNDASLVKALEALGIGRPSTYAPIIATLQARNYIYREQRALKPTEIGLMVNKLLVEHFSDIVDYQFTARLEDDLDEIANGQMEWLPMIKEFYDKFKKNLMVKEKEITKTFNDEKTDEVCPKCGKPLVIKMSRYGKFLACTGFPECRHTKSISNHIDSSGPLGKCPKCKEGQILPRRTKKGRVFYGCNRWPDCDYATWTRPNGTEDD